MLNKIPLSRTQCPVRQPAPLRGARPGNVGQLLAREVKNQNAPTVRSWVRGLLAVLTIAFLLRFYSLNSVPPHPSLDEVSIGYNAYSILTTGRDEYGEFMPILLRAYDDFRPALYVYLVIPFIKLFGLTTFAVRIPSVILSVLSIIAFYYLVKELFSKAAFKIGEIKIDIALLSAFAIAISPWHVYISRLGHEVNLFLATFIFALYFFYRAVNGKKKLNLIYSAIFFGISFSAYQSGKVFIPLILLVIFLLYFKKLLADKKSLLLSIVIGFIIIFPTIITLFQPNALIRFRGTSIFNEKDYYLKKSAENIIEARENNNFFLELINNRRFIYLYLPTQALISHVDPNWLFKNSGNEDFKVPDIGLLYLIELPILIAGLFFFISDRKLDRKIKLFFGAWFLIALIPGSVTSGYPHAMRIFQVVPMLTILAGYSVYRIISFFDRYKSLLLILFIVFSFANIYRFAYSYFYKFPFQNSDQFQFGVLQSFEKSKKIENRYDRIYVSNKDNLYQSYMFYLYATKFNPEKYLKSGGTESGGFAEEHQIGKYHFGDFDDVSENSLVIANPSEFKNGRVIDTIKNAGGEVIIMLIEKSK